MKTRTKTKKLLKGFTVDPTIKSYDNEPLFKLKVKKVNHILKTAGLPKDIS